MKNSPTFRIFSELNYTCTPYEVSEIKNQLKNLISGEYEKLSYDINQFENEKCVEELINYINSN